MHTPNYIGVTGLTTSEQVTHLAAVDEAREGKRTHDVMAEFLASARTVYGEQMSKRHVQSERDLRNLLDLTMQNGVSTAVHYEMKGDDAFPNSCINLIDRMMHARPDLLQLNGQPTPEQLKKIRNELRDVALVYQTSPEDYENTTMLYDALFEIRDYIHYVLLDASRGTGKPCDMELMKPNLLLLRDELPKLGIVIAGGQSAETIEATINATRSILRTPRFSVDAESKLFDPDTNILDTRRAGHYVIRANRALQPESR